MSFTYDAFLAFCGLISLIYLLNPTFGMFELIPDNIPIIGNLDEAAATSIVLYTLRHFGFDLMAFVDRGRRNRDRHDRND